MTVSSSTMAAVLAAILHFTKIRNQVNPRTHKGGGGGGMSPHHKVFMTFFPEEKTKAPDVFSSCSFIPRADIETRLVMVSYYGYQI